MSAVAVRRTVEGDNLDELNEGNALWMGAEQELRTVAAVPPDRGDAAIFVAEVDGQAVGCAVGIAAPGAAFGYGMARVYVQPPTRRQGVGTSLFKAVCDLCANRQLPGIMASVPDSEPDGLAAALHAGLVDHGHHIESALDLTAFDVAMARQEGERVRAAGVVLTQLPDDTDELTWRAVHAFFKDRLGETPDSREGGGNMPYEVFRSFLENPWQVLLARQQRTGEMVGITCLMPRADGPSRLNTMFTGVHPDSRGQNLSRALKAEQAQLMQAAGWSEILTQNMDGNKAILAVNAVLGFVPVGGTRDLGFSLAR